MRRTIRFSLCCLGALVLGALATGCGDTTDAAAAYRAGDFARSLALYRERAAAGDVDAANVVGIHYYLGLGVARDYELAVRNFQQAALANHADAQRNLGLMYMNGLGVAQDNQRAYGWFLHAYEQGNPRARAYAKFLADNVTPNAGQKIHAVIADEIRSYARGERKPGAP
ncbi:MAG: tetratricopeptide repeat protein [Gammaproteobacteria bacterium]